MKIINTTKNTLIADKAVVADHFISRAVGLLNRRHLDPGEALILRPCNSVHMFFMRFAIDLIFVNRENKVVRAISSLKPFRMTGIYPALFAVELPVGVIQASMTQAGDVIEISA